jgi:hypothetical protein
MNKPRRQKKYGAAAAAEIPIDELPPAFRVIAKKATR